MQVLPNGQVTGLPNSIYFDPVALTFTVEKCSAATIMTDPSCASPWVDTTYRLVIVATLNNAAQTANSEVFFDVTIFNDCASDSIAFTQALASP